MAFFSLQASCWKLIHKPLGQICVNGCRLKTSPSSSVSTVDQYMQSVSTTASKYTQHVDEAINRWAKCDEVYFGKDRNTKEFPAVKYPISHPKVRLGIFPDAWFQALYPKTGVTGPYMFLFGTTAFLLSKELWVPDAVFAELVFTVGLTVVLMKRYGHIVSEYLDKRVENMEQVRYYKPLQALHTSLDRTISSADEEIARAAVVQSVVKAKEENVELQIEGAYRDRLQHVHRVIRRRLDYHLERESARRRFQQHHLTQWVVDQVVKGITPIQEKETLTQCVNELKRLAQTRKLASPA